MLGTNLPKHQPWITSSATANRNVDGLPNQVHVRIVEDEVQADLWVRRQELEEPVNAEEVQKVRLRSHPHGPARDFSRTSNFPSRFLHDVDRWRAPLKKGEAGARQI